MPPEPARSLGVSYRVLNYACQDAFGVSPYHYFLTEKLHAVRGTLKTSDVSVGNTQSQAGPNRSRVNFLQVVARGTRRESTRALAMPARTP